MLFNCHNEYFQKEEEEKKKKTFSRAIMLSSCFWSITFCLIDSALGTRDLGDAVGASDGEFGFLCSEMRPPPGEFVKMRGKKQTKTSDSLTQGRSKYEQRKSRDGRWSSSCLFHLGGLFFSLELYSWGSFLVQNRKKRRGGIEVRIRKEQSGQQRGDNAHHFDCWWKSLNRCG